MPQIHLSQLLKCEVLLVALTYMIAIGTFWTLAQTKQTVKLARCGLWVVVEGYFIDQAITQSEKDVYCMLCYWHYQSHDKCARITKMPLRILDAYVKTPARLQSFCVSPKIMAKAKGFFSPFVCGVTLPSTALLTAITPQPPPCPFHPSVHYGTSAEVGCMGLTLAGSLVAGGSWTDSMSSQRKRDRVHSKWAGKKGSADHTMVSIHLRKSHILGGLSKHFT